jgi:hypothetical protein
MLKTEMDGNSKELSHQLASTWTDQEGVLNAAI